MSLLPCRECNREVSTEATTCPHCGVPYPTSKESVCIEPEWSNRADAYSGSPGRGKRVWGFEWRTEAELAGLPLVHIAIGRNELGRLRVAKGIIAIGQFAFGLITVAQFGIGLLFGFGQVILGLTAVAQVAITLLFAVGQLAVGYYATGQLALGFHIIAQAGFGKTAYTASSPDAEALLPFKELIGKLKAIF